MHKFEITHRRNLVPCHVPRVTNILSSLVRAKRSSIVPRSLSSVLRAKRSSLVLVLFSFCVLLIPRTVPADQTQLTPSLAVRGEYNDNIFFSTRNDESDFLGVITPGLQFTDKTERLDARISGALPIYTYADYDELNSIDQKLNGNLSYLLTTRLSTSLNAGYIKDSQPDREIAETGLVLGSVIRRRYSAGLAGQYAVSDIASLGLTYAYLNDDYDSKAYTDIQSQNVSLTFAQNLSRIFANTTGKVSLGYNRFDFSDSNVDNYTLMVGAEYNVTELYTLSADVGGRYTRSNFQVLELQPVAPGLFLIGKNEETQDNIGVVGRAALSYHGEQTTGSVSFFRDIATSGGREGTVQRTALVFDVGKRFTYELWGHLSAGYYLNTSDRSQYALQDIDEETWRVNPWAQYNFSHDLSLKASYSYIRVNYKTNDTDANRNVVFLGLVYRYPLLD